MARDSALPICHVLPYNNTVMMTLQLANLSTKTSTAIGIGCLFPSISTSNLVSLHLRPQATRFPSISTPPPPAPHRTCIGIWVWGHTQDIGVEVWGHTQDIGVEVWGHTQDIGVEVWGHTQDIGVEVCIWAQDIGVEVWGHTQDIGVEVWGYTQDIGPRGRGNGVTHRT